MPPVEEVLEDIVDGSLMSDCPLPCKTTQTHAKFLYEFKTDLTEIDITFSPKVSVTKTDLMKPTLSSVLSQVGFYNFSERKTKFQVGGAMGLWLGLGAVQILEIPGNCLMMVIRKYKGMPP